MSAQSAGRTLLKRRLRGGVPRDRNRTGPRAAPESLRSRCAPARAVARLAIG